MNTPQTPPEKNKTFTQQTLMNVLDWAYEKALNPGVPGISSAYDLAQEYQKDGQSLEQQVNALIRWQNTKAASSGFITGIGGALTLPVTIPANLSSVYYLQIRMIAAIAIMGGYDIREDKVKTLIYACLCGNATKEVLKDVGISLGTKITQQVVQKISKNTMKQVNQSVGFNLLSKTGGKGMINLGKITPILGGIIGGTVDALATNAIGKIAKEIFITSHLLEEHSNTNPKN